MPSPPQSLDESAARLALVTDAAELGIWDWNLLTDEIRYSERAKAIFGFPPSEAVTLEMARAATHPDDLPKTSAQARRALDPAIRERMPYEFRLQRPGKSIRWVIAHGRAVFETIDGVTRATRYVGTIQDITARKETENALRGSETRLRLALDAGRMAVWEFDARRNALTYSPELKRLLGFADEENPSLEEIRSRYFPGEQQKLRDAAQSALERGERFFEVEFRYQRPDGAFRWFLLRAEVQLDTAGEGPESAIGVLLDITERKTREEQLEFVMHELSHRSKNLLAVVQAMARLTAHNTSGPGEFEKQFLGRLHSLARTHDVLLEQQWRGAFLDATVRSQLEPFTQRDLSRIALKGPPVLLSNNVTHDLSIAIYELATNAVKYGALSTPAGRIGISWEVNADAAGEQRLSFTWKEHGGPVVKAPIRRGFGSAVLERLSRSQSRGATALTFAPGGVEWKAAWGMPDFSLTEAVAESPVEPAPQPARDNIAAK